MVSWGQAIHIMHLQLLRPFVTALIYVYLLMHVLSIKLQNLSSILFASSNNTHWIMSKQLTMSIS